MDKLRMQGKGAYGIVGVGILPAARHGGVVHRQQLDNALAGLHGPVHQFLEVVEFSHAEAVLRAEGEHRNGHAGSPPGFRGEAGLDIGQHYLGILGRDLREEMVGAFFPQADGLGLGIYDNKLVFDGFVDVHGNEPPGGNVVRHQMDAVPVAQTVSAAYQGQGLVAANLGGGHLDAHVAAGAALRTGMPEGIAVRPTENHLAEGGAVKGRIIRTVHPSGADDDVLAGGMIGI